ncbi:MAG TPA: hypothetical protein VJ739_07205 [Gemmataceae bacterium]|nr:hypothetical protein [Gemmataceae bacterium]
MKAKLPAGTVCVYVLGPDAHLADSLIVSDAARPERLLALLHRAIDTLKVTPGEPLVPPAHQSRAPHAGPGSVVLHLTARYLERQGNDYVRMHPVLGTARSGQWAHLPSEDWVVLSPAEARKLLPAGAVRPGTTWQPDREVMARLLTHFYPPTENTDVRKNRIDEQALKATVLAVQDGVARARVEGRLKMKHSFYHKDTDEFVDAPLVGILEFAADGSAVRSFRLVTDGATYGGTGARQHFGVAVRSEP